MRGGEDMFEGNNVKLNKTKLKNLDNVSRVRILM